MAIEISIISDTRRIKKFDKYRVKLQVIVAAFDHESARFKNRLMQIQLISFSMILD